MDLKSALSSVARLLRMSLSGGGSEANALCLYQARAKYRKSVQINGSAENIAESIADRIKAVIKAVFSTSKVVLCHMKDCGQSDCLSQTEKGIILGKELGEKDSKLVSFP